MTVMLNSRMKSIDLNWADFVFILEQVMWQPLDTNGNPLFPTVNANGTPVPGSVSVNPLTKVITFTVTLPDGSGQTVSYSYVDPLDYHGLREVSGLFNNLETGQIHFGQTDYPFLRKVDASYGNYLQPLQPADTNAFYGAKTFETASDNAPNYAVTGTTGAVVMEDVVDYTPRMITQSVASSYVSAYPTVDTVAGAGALVGTANAYSVMRGSLTIDVDGETVAIQFYRGGANPATNDPTGPGIIGINVENRSQFTVIDIQTAIAAINSALDGLGGKLANVSVGLDVGGHFSIGYTGNGTVTITDATTGNGQNPNGLDLPDTTSYHFGPESGLERAIAVNPDIITDVVVNEVHGLNGMVTTETENVIRNLNTLPGDPSTTGWFTLFGQFFDHGLDFIEKKSGYTITIPLAEDDPMYGQLGPDNQPVTSITISRATVSGIDAAGNPEYVNHTSPYIDQSQSYGSDEQITTLLREWVVDPNTGTYRPGMELFDGHTLGANATWTDWNGDITDRTLPTLNELRAHLIDTLRDDLTWEDISNYRARDAEGHVITGQAASLTDQSILLDMNPHFDAGHISLAKLQAIDASITGVTFGGPNLITVEYNGGLVTKGLFALVNPANFTITATGVDHDVASEILLSAVGDHYLAGDGRVNENFGLTSIHHVFHEEHNFNVDNILTDLTATFTDTANDVANNPDAAFQQARSDWQTQTAFTDGHGNYLASSGGEISWNVDRVFQAAKLITEMEYQHVAIDQYARLVTPDLPEFVAYDSGLDASISIEYSQAAFRFGHSQLRETIDAIEARTLDGGFDITGAVTKYALEAAFLNPAAFAEVGPGAIALGMSHQVSNEVDEFVTPALQQTLLGQPLDLAAINIARGRDVGLPTLNEVRSQLFAVSINGTIGSGDLHPYNSWSDFRGNMIHPESIVNFIAAYSFDGDVAAAQNILDLELSGDSAAVNFMNGGDDGFNRVDLWIGGLAEKHVFTGQLGSTFNAIFLDQMERLMDGDRFYYLYRLFQALPTQTNLNEQVVTEQFKDIIERTTGVTHLTGDVFGFADSYVELGNAASSAGAQGAEHKYGQTIAANTAANGGEGLGVFSGDGVSTAGNGLIQTKTVLVREGFPGATQGTDGNWYVTLTYVLDARPDEGDNPDGVTAASGYNSHEVIGGTNNNDYIQSGDGDDTTYGDDGDDILFGNGGADHIYGGAGNDFIDGGDIEDFLDGGEGDDWIFAGTSSGGIDIVIGGAGNDHLFGEAGIDEIYGGSGDDYIDAGGDTDLAFGGEGNDIMTGGDGPDELHGDVGDDQLDGGVGDDVMFGEAGDDIISPGVGAAAANDGDRLDGGDGFDLASYANLASTVQILADLNQQNIDRAGPLGNTYIALEGVIGSTTTDTLIGDGGDNWLIGGSGNDIATGGAGNDVIVGGSIALADMNSIITQVDNAQATHFTSLLDSYPTFVLGDGGTGNAAGTSDKAVFSDDFDQYTIVQPIDTNGSFAGHSVLIVDGPDGRDVLIDVDVLSFADGDRNANDLSGGGGPTQVPVLDGTAATLAGPEVALFTFSQGDLLQGWSDPGAGTLSVQNVAIGGGLGGVLVDNHNGTYTYQAPLFADVSATADVTFIYQVTNGAAAADASLSLDLAALSTMRTNGDDLLIGTAAGNNMNTNSTNGGGGNDIMLGLGGVDTINGVGGNNIYVATIGDGNDTYVGSANDTYDLSRTNAAATITLGTNVNAGAGSAVSSDIGTDNIGNTKNVVGSTGNDTIIANNGQNTMAGWLGADTFVFNSTGAAGNGATRDVIVDFQLGVDKIDISAINPGGGASAFDFIGFTGAGHPTIHEVGFHYETVSGVEHTIIEGETNNNSSSVSFQIALVGHIALTASDFHL